MTGSTILFEVRASYDAAMYGDPMENAIKKAAGRVSDFSGMGMCARDHGWNCRSEIEASKIAHALRKIGLRAEIMNLCPSQERDDG